MTRINLIDPAELCDQHLLAELRELKRIPNSLLSGKLNPTNIPERFCLGKGHVKFFSDKLEFLCERYFSLLEEATMRGFKVSSLWPDRCSNLPLSLWKDYTPTEEDTRLSRERIEQKMPIRARWTRRA